jgi:VWFA-related protein
MPPTRLVLLTALLTLAVATIPAQQSSAPDPIPTLHVTTRIVALDVVVNDGHGHPSTGLRPSDLILTEDGVPQTILSLVEHDASEAPHPASAATLPPNTFAAQPPALGNGAVTIIVLGNMAWDNAPFVRDQIRAFLAKSPISTPIAIFRQDWQGMHLIQGLTADRTTLLEAANSQRILPPLGFELRYARLAASPFAILNRYIAMIPGRINLIWFGGGSTIPGEDETLSSRSAEKVPSDFSAFLRSSQSASVHRLNRIAFYPILSQGLVAPAICMAAHCPPADVENVSFTRALAILPCLETRLLALSAGGEAFCDTNGFKEALTQVVTTGSHFYTVSYRPTNPNWDGKFRHINIQLANPPPMSNVDKFDQWIQYGPGFLRPTMNYRDGYFARDTPAPRASSSDPGASTNALPAASASPNRILISVSSRGQGGIAKTPVEQAMSFAVITPTQVHFTIAVTSTAPPAKLKPGDVLPVDDFVTEPFRDAPYRNCKIHYSIDPKDLHFTPTLSGGYSDALQFIAIVYRDDGLVANSIAYTANIQIAAGQIEDIQANGITFDQTIAMPVPGNPIPGYFFLRAGVDELSTGHIGTLEVPVEWIKPTPPGAP